MSRRLVTVIYEDRHAKGETHFGPHMLLLACVADRTQSNRFALLRRVTPIASGGDGNVRRKLRDNGDALAALGPLVAMFDSDKIRTRYDLDHALSEAQVVEAILHEAQDSPKILLLVRNMEDLVAACCAALKRPIPTGKPTPEERDHVLQAAAGDSDAVRTEILRRVPSFERLVDEVGRLLASL